MCGNSKSGHLFDHEDFAQNIALEKGVVIEALSASFAKGDFHRAGLIAERNQHLFGERVVVAIPPAAIAAAALAAERISPPGLKIRFNPAH